MLTRSGPACPAATRSPRSRKGPALAPGPVPSHLRQRPRLARIPAWWYDERPVRYPTASGTSSTEAVTEISDVLASVGDTCPECPPSE